MSMTFRLAGTQYETVERYEPEYGDRWVEYNPVPPYTELNMSNSNACSLLALLDPAVAPDYCGEWAGEKLAAVQARCMKLLNNTPGSFVTGTVQDGNTIYVGRDLDYVRDRLTRMLEILALAVQKQDRVVWS